VLIRYSVEVEKVYIILQQTYAGNCMPTFIKSPEYCSRYYRKHFVFFLAQCIVSRFRVLQTDLHRSNDKRFWSEWLRVGWETQ